MAEKALELVAIGTSGRQLPFSKFVENINAFTRTLSELPARTFKKVPATVYPTVANRARGYWRENYNNRRQWLVKKHTVTGARQKNWEYRRGNTFRLSPMGKLPMIGNSSTFGLRTGNIRDTITSRRGTDVQLRQTTVTTGDTRSFDLAIQVRVKPEVFDAGDSNRRFIGKTRRRTKVSTGNYFQRFSQMITPGGIGATSVLVRLWDEQLDNIRRFIRDHWTVAARDVVQTELLAKLR
jgi:hypothetical protein